MSKIIKAVFTGRFCKTQRVFQFDTDDKLQIVNVDLPANYTVDFSNSKTGDSVSVLATSDTVQIPPDLFVPGSEIYAWIWLSDSNGGHTRCEATIPIDPRARRTGTEPTPAQASAWDEAVDTLNETIEGIPTVINSALTEAKESGEFDGEDGADGSGVWYTTGRVSGEDNPFVLRRDLIGREGATVQVHDLLFAPDVRDEGEPTTLYEITSVGTACTLKRLCKMQGEDGTSPGVTITEIEGGHRITITDEAHPDGQSFDVMDGQGGSGSSDYNDLSNKPQIAGVTLSGDKSLADLGIAAASDIPTVPVQSVNNKTGAVVLNASDVGAGTYSKPSGGIPKSDLASAVQTSLGKADTALQSAPVTSVNGQTGAVSLSIPSTASDVGAVAANQGSENATKVLIVSGLGDVVPGIYNNQTVVFLTITGMDYSGTMNMTPAGLKDAFFSGRQIIADIPAINCRANMLCNERFGDAYAFTFVTIGEFNGQDVIARFTTSATTSTFTTKIYPLATGQWTGGSY